MCSAAEAAELTSHDMNFSGQLSLILADNPDNQGHHKSRRTGCSGRPPRLLALLPRLDSWIAENIKSEYLCAFLQSIVLVVIRFHLPVDKSKLAVTICSFLK